MGVPIGQNGLELANFAQNWVSGRPRFGVGDPRSRVWEAQIRDQGPQIWPILAKFVVPKTDFPFGGPNFDLLWGSKPR